MSNNGRTETSGTNWFAVYTIPRHEKRVEAHFRVRDIESFLPLYHRDKQWKDHSRGTVQVPLFSSYIFVRLNRASRVPVLGVPGVISIVGVGPNPQPVPDAYIHFLQEAVRLRKIEPYPYPEAGAKVRIRSGPMAGVEGVLMRVKNSLRVVLMIEAIMRSVMVEVGLEEIEPLGPSSSISGLQSVASGEFLSRGEMSFRQKGES